MPLYQRLTGNIILTYFSEQFMVKVSDEAIRELDIFKDSDAKNSLILLVKYNLERTK